MLGHLLGGCRSVDPPVDVIAPVDADAVAPMDVSEPEVRDVSAAPDAVDTAVDVYGPDAMGPGLRGVLRDSQDRVIPDAVVLACTRATCYFGRSEMDGRFFFPLEPPLDVALKTPPILSTVPRRAAALFPVRIIDGTLVDVGVLYAPDLPAGTPIEPAIRDPQTLAAGDGLDLTLRRADLTAPLDSELDTVAARAIPAARVPALPGLGAERVVAVYALHPFATTSSSPIGVRAPSTLPAGTPVNFRSISELDGHLSAPAPGHADGTFVSTDPSAGLTELTWLVISQ